MQINTYTIENPSLDNLNLLKRFRVYMNKQIRLYGFKY